MVDEWAGTNANIPILSIDGHIVAMICCLKLTMTAERFLYLIISLPFCPKYFFFIEVLSFSISYFACFLENRFDSRSYLCLADTEFIKKFTSAISFIY